MPRMDRGPRLTTGTHLYDTPSEYDQAQAAQAVAEHEHQVQVEQDLMRSYSPSTSPKQEEH